MATGSLPEGRRQFRGYGEAGGAEGAAVLDQVLAQRKRLAERLSRIRHVVAVASGKGGVGKSVVTANLAAALATTGSRVGAVDADLNGPSLARMLDAARGPLAVAAGGIRPAEGVGGVRLISMDLLLASADAPVRWRGPGADDSLWRGALETGALRELIADVAWGDLDFLLVDLPPGTDRIERLLELVPGIAHVLLVTTPSEAACRVVLRSARLLRDAGFGRVALVTNMASYRCPCCGCESPHFAADAGLSLLEAAGLPRWVDIPFDPALGARSDAGSPPSAHPGGLAAAKALRALAERLRQECDA